MARKAADRGAALLVFLTVLVVGSAWFTIGALAKAAPSSASREMRTGEALQAAKLALLGYAAQYAARTDHNVPGRLPCPELPTSIGTASEGVAPGSCSNVTAEIGRLPWKTLGVDRIVDGSGESLWYVLSPGFRQSPVNFATPGQLTLDGAPNAAVALIIAPGTALDTQLDADTPPAGCARRNQGGSRSAAPLNALDFVECGNATGSYVTAGTSKWLNDRVLAVTAAEWADAIAGSVADRLQRQVAPALADWHQTEFAATGKSWAATHGISYLPFASTWGNPTMNSFCGSDGIYEGLPPTSLTCSNNPWIGSTSSLINLSLSSCADAGGYLRCTFTIIDTLLGASVRITATALDVGQTYRSTIALSEITVSSGGSKAPPPLPMTLLAISGSNSDATLTLDVSWPPLSLGPFYVDIPHLQQAAVLTDSRLTWFRDNQWHQYTYYAITPGAAAPGTSACTPGTNCLTANGLPTSTGDANDKRLVLALSGRTLAGHTQPSANLDDYLESQNVSTGDDTYATGTISTTFNDWIAVCPFRYLNHSGSAVTICN